MPVATSCAVAAPGSVLLLGEYAVTEPDGSRRSGGAPSTRYTLRLIARRPAAHRWAAWERRRFAWTPRHCDSPLFTALVAECGPSGGSITVDSTQFAGPHGKLGLGSSAAVAVAVAALLAACRQADRVRIRDRDDPDDRDALSATTTCPPSLTRSEAGH